MSIRYWLVCGAAVASPALLSAQHTKPGAARVAGIAPPPSPPVQAPRPHLRGAGFHGRIPVLLLSDGRMFADFGRGYEQVVQSCGLPGAAVAPVVAPGPVQPVVIQPTVTQPSAAGVQALPYTPPVPAQQTASQQMAQAAGTVGVPGQSCTLVRVGGQVVGVP